MTTNTIKKVLAEHGLTPETQSLDVLIFDEVNGTRISVIDLLEEVDEAARAAEQADMAKRNEIHEKYHELNDKDIEINTAKKIFAELDPIIQVLDVNDQNCLKVIIAVQALKKRYRVD